MKYLLIITLLFLQASIFGQLRLDNQNRLYLNHSGSQIGSASFTISQPSEGFAGMYINSMGNITQKPFYGYAVGGLQKAWHYYDGTLDYWALYLGGTDQLQIDEDSTKINNNLKINGTAFVGGDLMVNTNTQINQFTDFTLKCNELNDFGGMYVDVDGTGLSKPFYGYAVNGVPKAFSFYNQSDDSWNLNVNSFYDIIVAKSENVTINGSLRLNVTNDSGAETGTIFYYSDHFYGITPLGVIRLDNESSSIEPDSDIEIEMQKLKEENTQLLKKLAAIENHLQSLDEKVARKSG